MSRLRGRFSAPTSEEFERFSSSLEVDLEMAGEDIEGSIAHATMLGEVGVLTAEEAAQLVAGLSAVATDLASGAWKPEEREEDIHMAVEARLTAKLGELGGKLHTARSRNDQVAVDLRLWLKRQLAEVDLALEGLIEALLGRIERDGRVLMAGYTHLQRGQPIWFGHHLLAHAWPLVRDRQRFADALGRLDSCPLGACAMAGTSHPIDRERTAELLGFAAVTENAMDSVAARDHVQEVTAACAICMTHLSRMAEELVVWSSSEVAFVRLGETYATGSSIMPQKRNPDAAELVRGKAGRVYGDLQALLTMVKAQPLAYNRDLQEDREALFDAVHTTLACVRISAGMWSTLEVDRDRFAGELVGDFSLATELADLMAVRGVPFRQAHEAVGEIVRWCEEQGGNLSLLTVEVAASFGLELTAAELADCLDPEAAAERRTSHGGTAWCEIERQVGVLRGG